jgi:hypothetical protein
VSTSRKSPPTQVSRKLNAAEKKQLAHWERTKNWSVPTTELAVLDTDNWSFNVMLDYWKAGRSFDPKLWQGRPALKAWPSNVSFAPLSGREWQRLTEYADMLGNSNDVLVVSEAFKQLLEDQRVTGIEFLPVKIHGTAKYPCRIAYWIAHVTKVLDCVDKEKSDVGWTKWGTTMVGTSIRRLVVKSGPPAGVKMFRIKNLLRIFVVTQALAQAIRDAGLSGIMFWPLEKTGR